MEKIEKHKDVSVGDFVKVKQTDGLVKERMDFSGQVLRVGEFIEVKTFDGTIGFTLTTDEYSLEMFKLGKKPTGWDKFIKNPGSQRPPEKVAKTAINKKEQVFSLVKSNPRKQTDSLVKLAIKEVGGNPAVINQYVQLAIMKFRKA